MKVWDKIEQVIIELYCINYIHLVYIDGLVQEKRNSMANALELMSFLH